jgi:short-subunit dehydrogenase
MTNWTAADLPSFAERTVIITGANSGLGAVTARELARRGATIVMAVRDTRKGETAARTMAGQVEVRELDLADLSSVRRFADGVGKADVLINNAGIMPVTEFENETADSIARQLELNLRAVIFGTQQAVQRMRPRRAGHIVNVASAAGKGGFPGVVTYCSTKFGVVGLTEALSHELHGSGIDFSCVMPAIVRTELTDGIKDHWLIKTSTPEQVADAIVEALKKPRLDVFVPKSLNALNRSMALLPRRGQAWFLRATGADHLLADAAHSPAREAYERRAAGK